MAISSRRGPYNNFDPEKLLPGEWAVVLNGDPNADDGMSVYICFSVGTVKRMATYEDMQENINTITGDIQNDLLQGVSAAISNAENATLSATNAAESATSAADDANSALSAIQSAVSGTVINDSQSSQYTVFSSKYIDDNCIKKYEDISECTAEFSESIERENIETGESVSTILGKIKKFFADLKIVAFTGLYSDLSGRPTLGTASSKNVANNLTTSSSGTSVLDAYQGKVLDEKKLNKASVVNNLITTLQGYALDARQGKVLDEKIRDIGSYSELSIEESEAGTWINGKPIYKKTVNIGEITSGLQKNVNHGIANVDEIWVDLSDSFLKASNGNTYMLPRVSFIALNQTVEVVVTKTQIFVNPGSDAGFADCYVTVRYTKTTD